MSYCAIVREVSVTLDIGCHELAAMKFISRKLSLYMYMEDCFPQIVC